jgi:methyl-accepting chemotaxis protein
MECASTAAVSGASVVNTVSLQLDQLRATIRDITGASSEVSEGVTQQLNMCSDIRGGMARMIESITEMSQANHETASSASGLSDTANQVQGLVAKFKVHDMA